jgi:hypothetical protein
MPPGAGTRPRSGGWWRWVTVESRPQLIGPDDPHPEVDDERLRLLLGDIFSAAGGTHEDWPTYDRVMREGPRRLPARQGEEAKEVEEPALGSVAAPAIATR